MNLKSISIFCFTIIAFCAMATKQAGLASPIAIGYASPTHAAPGQAITFDGSASYDNNPTRHIISYNWDFGDGNTGGGSVRAHPYAFFGTYSVRLDVQNDDVPSLIGSTSFPIFVDVGNHAPFANAGGPYSGTIGDNIMLDAGGSSDQDTALGGGIVNYRWDLDGDGTFETIGGPQLTLTPAQYNGLLHIGDNPISLRVTDALGASTIGSGDLMLTALPEPSTFILGGLGSICLLTVVRSRRNSR